VWAHLVPSLLCCCLSATIDAHEETADAFGRSLVVAQAAPDAASQPVDRASTAEATCQLTIALLDDFTRKPLPGLVRITSLDTGQAVALEGQFHRGRGWYALAGKTTVRVPSARLRVEGLQGLETELAASELDLSTRSTAAIELPLRRFYETQFRELYAGNTHLHLMKMSRADAERYLQVVPRADKLDLVFLSHLRRIPDEKDYVSNEIVEESMTGDVLQRLSGDGTILANGQEHRHNFGRGGQGYGHVMMLNLPQLIRPVSLGPGIMGSGTDGQPLQLGIRAARDDKATVIWCHSDLGYEDIPSWVGGLVDAQNIFDGSTGDTYERAFYRYLNLGMRVPFSTGTDWFIYDFARVYVPVSGELSTQRWLESLRDGRSYITNGPFLELETERAEIGGTQTLNSPNEVTVVGRGMGRLDFGGLELVYNGRVVHRVRATSEGGYYYADMRYPLFIDRPGWFALRIPSGVGDSELGRPLFAHTSPIYVELQGKQIFRVDVARELIEEIRRGMAAIEEKGKFGSDAERRQVLEVYRASIANLEQRIEASGRPAVPGLRER
jgi:hypothetical protein